jgi:hypothetical protein
MSTKEKRIVGVQAGGDLLPDGSLQIAPMYYQQLAEINDEYGAISILLNSVTSHCIEAQKRLNRKRRILWMAIKENYSLTAENYAISADGTTITPVKSEAATGQEPENQKPQSDVGAQSHKSKNRP